MQYGCDQRCPRVRANLQKLQKARERGEDNEKSLFDGRDEAVAGPSGLQRVRSPPGVQKVRSPPGVQKVRSPSGVQKVRSPSGVQKVRSPAGVQKVGSSSLRRGEIGSCQDVCAPTPQGSKTTSEKRRDSLRDREYGRKRPSRDDSLREIEYGRESPSRVHGLREREYGRESPSRSNGRKYDYDDFAIPGTSKGITRDEAYTSHRRVSPSGKPLSRSRKFQGDDRILRKSQEEELRRVEYGQEDERETGKRPGPDGPARFPASKKFKTSSSSKKTRKRRESSDDFDGDDDEELLGNFHDDCIPDCRGINERLRRLKNEKEQELLDEYIISKALPYFADLCNCHCACLVNQLWKDSFVMSTITSAALFAIGVKLCSELNGWTI